MTKRMGEVPWWIEDERVPEGMMVGEGVLGPEGEQGPDPDQGPDGGAAPKHEMTEWTRVMARVAEDGAAIEAARLNDPAERLTVYLAQIELHKQLIIAGHSHALGMLEEAQNFFEYCLRLEQRCIALEDELVEEASKREDAEHKLGELVIEKNYLKGQRDELLKRYGLQPEQTQSHTAEDKG